MTNVAECCASVVRDDIKEFNSSAVSIIPGKELEYYHSPENDKYISSISSYSTRTNYTSIYAWSIYTKETLDAIASYVKDMKCIDVAGGAGLFTKFMRERGVDIDLNDLVETCEEDDLYCREYQWCHVDIPGDARDIDYSKYGCVFMFWPPCVTTDEEENDAWDIEVLKKLRPGTTVVYLGESYGGCTGSRQFHSYLDVTCEYKKDISNLLNSTHIKFYGMYDRYAVYVTK